MAKLNRTLARALKAHKPETMNKLAKACVLAANRSRNSASVLDEAAKAFAQGDYDTGIQMLQRAECCLSSS